VSVGSAPFVIIGAGQAGAWVARTLRSEGFSGRVVLIGDEAYAPYERPPLSKSLLNGSSDLAAATLLSNEQALAADIELWTAAQAESVDPRAKIILCRDGRTLDYERLFITTGGRPRRLNAAPVLADRIHVLRTFEDARRLRDAMSTGRSLIVLGGGWIGLEVAATARQMGLDVAIVEAAGALCARSLPAEVSNFLLTLHRGRGAQVRLGAGDVAISQDADRVVVKTANEEIRADHLLIGIGMEPNVELAATAGLDLDNGIVVDAQGRTSDPDIYAAGDVTSQPSWLLARPVRLESWANAQNQAIVAAKSALGREAAHDEAPWIWSDQYDVNLQIAGHPERATSLYVRGAPCEGRGCWLAVDGAGRAIGGVGVNAPKELRLIRKHLQARTTPDIGEWANDATPLNKITALR